MAKAIKNICSYGLIGYKAVFTKTPEDLPSDFNKKITNGNFFIFDEISNTIYLTFNNLMAMLYLPSSNINKSLVIFGSDIEQPPNYPWLNNWFDQTKSVGSVNALVRTNTDFINYFFEGVDAERSKVETNDNENTYKYTLIAVCVVSAFLLVATSLTTYACMKKYKFKRASTLLLNSEEDNSTNPI
jgi:hypothetical protein